MYFYRILFSILFKHIKMKNDNLLQNKKMYNQKRIVRVKKNRRGISNSRKKEHKSLSELDCNQIVKYFFLPRKEKDIARVVNSFQISSSIYQTFCSRSMCVMSRKVNMKVIFFEMHNILIKFFSNYILLKSAM